MTFQVRDAHPTLTLDDAHGNHMEIWPGEGFNWFRWAVEHGGKQELIWSSPDLFTEKRPTRSGNPILFPFPNRIRAGRYSWAGKDYTLPLDRTGKNAIHGFAVNAPWRVVDSGSAPTHAWVTGQFQASKDAPAAAPLWPADWVLNVTYRFYGQRVRLEVEVVNPDSKPLPFGLGFHPYFSLSAFGREEAMVGVPARRYWPLQENLPIDGPRAVTGMTDLVRGQQVGALRLDDVLTDLDSSTRNAEGLARIGWIDDWQQRRSLEVFASAAFREVVVFNPVHREAFCIEPYTCTTDAMHLSQEGHDAGLMILGPGAHWHAVVEFVFSPRQ